MSVRTYSMVIGAGETRVLPAGRFFLITRAASAVTLTARGTPGSPSTFENVGAGLSYGPVPDSKAWTYLDLFSAAAQTVEVIVSDDAEVRVGSVVSVAGSVTIQEVPSATLADTADVGQAINSQTVIPANGARRRITIGCLSTSAAPNVRVSQAGGAGRGIEIAAGTFAEFKTTAALTVRNNDGTNIATWYAEEES